MLRRQNPVVMSIIKMTGSFANVAHGVVSKNVHNYYYACSFSVCSMQQADCFVVWDLGQKQRLRAENHCKLVEIENFESS